MSCLFEFSRIKLIFWVNISLSISCTFVMFTQRILHSSNFFSLIVSLFSMKFYFFCRFILFENSYSGGAWKWQWNVWNGRWKHHWNMWLSFRLHRSWHLLFGLLLLLFWWWVSNQGSAFIKLQWIWFWFWILDEFVLRNSWAENVSISITSIPKVFVPNCQTYSFQSTTIEDF